jgi:hypothetical protein
MLTSLSSKVTWLPLVLITRPRAILRFVAWQSLLLTSLSSTVALQCLMLTYLLSFACMAVFDAGVLVEYGYMAFIIGGHYPSRVCLHGGLRC